MYMVYLREGCCFSLACILFEVKVDVQKGALTLEKQLTVYVLVSSNLCCRPLLSYANSPPMTTMFILDGLCICVLGFLKVEALGVLVTPLIFSLHIMAKVLLFLYNYCSFFTNDHV